MSMSDSELQEYGLASGVDAYIISRLEWPRALGRSLAREKDISRGSKITLLPADTDIEAIINFEHGGIGRRQESIKWLVEKMQLFLKQGKDRVIVFQEAFARPKDEYIENLEIPVISYEDEVYFALSADKSEDSAHIEQILITADSHFMLGVMSSLATSQISLPRNLEIDLIAMLARRTEHLIVSAFDEEGYIVCSFVA